MSLPREIAHAALNGNLDTVRQFVDLNPECVNDDVLIEDHGVRAYAAPHRLAAHASDAARNCLERACFLEPAPRVSYCIRMSNCTSKILSDCSSTPLIEGFRFPN